MSESSRLIQVTVKTLDSQSRTYSVSGELTVKQFKEHITASVEIPVDKQRLIYQGRVLQDGRKLTEYNVDGKVIHLVERAPPQASMAGPGGAGVSSGWEDSGVSSSHASNSSQHASQDRNRNVAVLGTFNLPVNIMGPQQIQINVDPAAQSEARIRLQLSVNLLRDAYSLIRRLERVSRDSPPEVPPPPFSFSSSSSSAPSSFSSDRAVVSQSLDNGSAPSSSTSTQTEGTSSSTGLDHPSPAEFVDVLSEVRRMEERLQPFIERTHSILGSATSADYNNNIEEREEDQRVLNLVGDALCLLGNTLVVLGNLRCNLAAPPPRHLYVVRPITHLAHPVMVQAGLPHVPLPINLGTTVTMASNGRQISEGPPPQTAGQSEQQAVGQTPPTSYNGTNHQGETGGPRVIQITHQTMEPVVMMQMNINGESAAASHTAGQTPAAQTPQTGLPPEFMQAIVHQISQQAAVMVAAASGGDPSHMTPGSGPAPEGTTTPQPSHPTQARVVITRPSFSPRLPPPTGTRRTTINLRATVPSAGQAPPLPPPSLTQMISGLVGQLLTPGHTGDHMISSSSDSSSTSPPPSTNPTQTSTHLSNMQPAEGTAEGNLAQLLGSLLGGTIAAGGRGTGSGPAPSITVTLPGGPGFFQDLSDSNQPPAGTPGGLPLPRPVGPTAPQPVSSGDSLSQELFTGIVQGILSTMMSSLGAQQGGGESIAQFIQRLSQTSNLFSPGSGDAVGFFGDLLSLVCQSFSMVDMVLLLHGNAQPLSRIQPQLRDFFTEHYLQGREPTETNISAAAEELINGLEEYITDTFASETVRGGVDIVQTNLLFLRLKFTQMASHILHCSDQSFGPRLLLLCTQGLFECLALNLFCLRGEQRALTTVINHMIRRMSAEVNPSLVNWLTSMMSIRLHVILDHNPVTEDHIQGYVIYTQVYQRDREQADPSLQSLNDEMAESVSPTADSLKEEDGGAATSGAPQHPAETSPAQDQNQEAPEVETWAAAVPPEWVPIIRNDQLSQRKIKAQPPLSDAYLHGMPAKRRKTSQSEGPHLLLSEAVCRAARAAGVLPVTPPLSLQWELERPELQEEYTRQVKSDISERVREDPDYSSMRFPNTHQAFSAEDS
ncbi:large proline-rich protein BAG6 isoform X2 [Halichoeres trimaculatus]|uniref:large proline-rich protein BAG6 isoform X2 n=1 Tax=Halichoeres trimaculatus TaxID=147232 RepID=UPI003D9E7572